MSKPLTRALLLRAMQTAIAQGLRARNEPPEELPPELAVLLERERRAAIVLLLSNGQCEALYDTGRAQ